VADVLIEISQNLLVMLFVVDEQIEHISDEDGSNSKTIINMLLVFDLSMQQFSAQFSLCLKREKLSEVCVLSM